MGLVNWWRQNRAKAQRTRQSMAWNDDQSLIAKQVPELVGMTDVQGMAHVLTQIGEWNKVCTPAQATTFAGRLKASSDTFDAEGLTMPYWANLWILRTYQKQLGMDVPEVAPSANGAE